MITRTLNPQAIIIEDAQSEMRQAIFTGYWRGYPKDAILKEVNRIVDNTKKKLSNKALVAIVPYSLILFANRVYRELNNAFGLNGLNAFKKIKLASEVKTGQRPVDFATRQMGIPTQKYAKEYMQKVAETMKKLSSIEALDTEDTSGRNSLRNKAEMEVRYQSHFDEIDELKVKGIRLVVSSVHADCSDRCYPFQGRIYSLDGSSGMVDGRTFEPLERATDVYYITKTGKAYKNGLLGFNCRHKLYEYRRGMEIQKVSKETQKKETAINTKQRVLEAQVRKYREEALALKNIDRESYLQARSKSIEWNKKYQAFSHENGRAYYPDRVKVFE